MNLPIADYYDGLSAKPKKVLVRETFDSIDLLEPEENIKITSFIFKNFTHNKLGNNHFIYLDATGLKYLQFAETNEQLTKIIERIEKEKTGIWHRLIRQKLGVLIPALLATLVGMYFLLITLIPWIGTKLITKKQEIAFGNSILKTILRDHKLLTNETKDSAKTLLLQSFADKIFLSKDYPITITVLNDNTVNAFALPGGNVVVYTGIVEKMKSAEELAALLAHESTHVNQRHSLKSILRSAANGIIIGIMTNDASGILATIASSTNTINQLNYSRRLETEADQMGMEILIQNNINPTGMKSLMETLDKESVDVPKKLKFLSSHPLTVERINAATEFAKKHPVKETRKDLESLFQKIMGK